MTQKFWIYLSTFVGMLLFCAVVARFSFLTFVENYELAYMFNKSTGKTELLIKQDSIIENGKLVRVDTIFKTGYIYSRPFVDAVHTIDLRPMQVCINANNRVLNCKLVEFDPKGFKTFMKYHGRGDYTQENMKDILMSYAYDPESKTYDFLNIKKELKNEDTTITSIKGTNDGSVVSDTISK